MPGTVAIGLEEHDELEASGLEVDGLGGWRLGERGEVDRAKLASAAGLDHSQWVL